jgi:hypothetical protein
MFSNARLAVRGTAACLVILGHLGLAQLLLTQPVAILRERRTEPRPLRPLVARFVEDAEDGAPSHANFWLSSMAAPPHLDQLALPGPPKARSIAFDALVESEFISSAGDLAKVERLQGIYRSQISARLVRLLQEMSLGDLGNMRCEINVVQDMEGQVLDVLTDQCPYSAATLDSLAKAVRAASPLPLPPQGLAIGSYLTLDIAEIVGSEQTGTR